MSSNEPSDWLDLEKDLVTTPEDVRALRENRPLGRAGWLESFEALQANVPRQQERRRKTFEGYRPFDL